MCFLKTPLVPDAPWFAVVAVAVVTNENELFWVGEPKDTEDMVM